MLWIPVPGFHDYEVSEHGDIRRGSKLLSPERVQGNGRKRFALSKGGRRFVLKAHQIVALAFIGHRPFDGAEVVHKDGFIHNNHYSNLRWGTRAENEADAFSHKLKLRGPRVTECDRLRADANYLMAEKGQ